MTETRVVMVRTEATTKEPPPKTVKEIDAGNFATVKTTAISLNNVHICPRWHIKGVCFKECNLKNTHKVISNDEVCLRMDEYCRLFQRE